MLPEIATCNMSVGNLQSISFLQLWKKIASKITVADLVEDLVANLVARGPTCMTKNNREYTYFF